MEATNYIIWKKKTQEATTKPTNLISKYLVSTFVYQTNTSNNLYLNFYDQKADKNGVGKGQYSLHKYMEQTVTNTVFM